jgi:hypothetical protein
MRREDRGGLRDLGTWLARARDPQRSTKPQDGVPRENGIGTLERDASQAQA